jgi:hypothetical protein
MSFFGNRKEKKRHKNILAAWRAAPAVTMRR